jgi:acetyl esterase/lipase
MGDAARRRRGDDRHAAGARPALPGGERSRADEAAGSAHGAGRLSRRALVAAALLGSLGGCSPARLASALAPREGYLVRQGLAYGALPRQRLDLYVPAAAPPDAPLLVFFHGGSWRSGERGEYRFVGQSLSALGLVAVPDYRLFPEAAWPAFLEDGAAAVTWVLREAPGRRVFLLGHSAGGFIAAALALDPRWGVRDAVAGCVALAGPFDFAPERGLRPIFAAAPEGRAVAVPAEVALAGAPPVLLLHGAADAVVEPVQSRRLAGRLRAAGVPVRLVEFDGVGHLGVLTPLVEGLVLQGPPVREAVAAFVGGMAG